jgi:hypothetical protein
MALEVSIKEEISCFGEQKSETHNGTSESHQNAQFSYMNYGLHVCHHIQS